MKTIVFKMLILGVVLFTGATILLAEEMKATEAPAMTEEQKAMQARMQEFTTVNENHKALEALVGSWKTNVKFWMDPKGAPEESEGTSEGKMIMGGRFLEQTFTGTAMGQPFEGRGIYGYDNLRKEYTVIWLDNMATGIMISAGKYDPTNKTLTEVGSMSCPITNEAHRWYRAVTTLTDVDHYTYETYMKDKDGTEFKAMLITYTRLE